MIGQRKWETRGLRIELIPSRPIPETQRWSTPHLVITYLAAPALDDPDAVAQVIRTFAEAGQVLEQELATFSSGTLDL